MATVADLSSLGFRPSEVTETQLNTENIAGGGRPLLRLRREHGRVAEGDRDEGSGVGGGERVERTRAIAYC